MGEKVRAIIPILHSRFELVDSLYNQCTTLFDKNATFLSVDAYYNSFIDFKSPYSEYQRKIHCLYTSKEMLQEYGAEESILNLGEDFLKNGCLELFMDSDWDSCIIMTILLSYASGGYIIYNDCDINLNQYRFIKPIDKQTGGIVYGN